MKKYIDAQLQVVRVNNKDIVTASTLNVNNTAITNTAGDAPDRFRDWED